MMRRAGDAWVDTSASEAAAALQDRGGLLWVDIAADERSEGEPLLRDVFGFHHLTIDDCYNAHIDPPKVDDYGDYLFIIIHAVGYDAEAQKLSTTELDLYIGPNYVVSLHQEPVRATDEVRRRLENHAPLMTKGADFLAHALFDVVVDDLHPVVETIDDEVAAIEERVIAHPERETLERVLVVKRNAQRLKRSILPQRDVANRFARGEYRHLISEPALVYFRDIYDHTVRVEEMIDSVRDLADNALNTYLSSINNRINEVMKTLAIVTAVFLPLTLIAGIYGTNFENVPEYGWHYGFALMIVGMLVLTAGFVAWFRWRHWI